MLRLLIELLALLWSEWGRRRRRPSDHSAVAWDYQEGYWRNGRWVRGHWRRR